jgi:hypothetical protein
MALTAPKLYCWDWQRHVSIVTVSRQNSHCLLALQWLLSCRHFIVIQRQWTVDIGIILLFRDNGLLSYRPPIVIQRQWTVNIDILLLSWDNGRWTYRHLIVIQRQWTVIIQAFHCYSETMHYCHIGIPLLVRDNGMLLCVYPIVIQRQRTVVSIQGRGQ